MLLTRFQRETFKNSVLNTHLIVSVFQDHILLILMKKWDRGNKSRWSKSLDN